MFPIAPPHPRDARISFRESNHSYTVEERKYTSVTQWYKSFFGKFQAKRIAEEKAGQPGTKYAELKTADAVLQSWQDKCTLGTHMHARIERLILDEAAIDEDDIEVRQCHELLRCLAPKIKAVACEKRIWDDEFGIAGTVDFIAWTSSKAAFILDWKRIDKLWPQGFNGKMGTRDPCKHLPDCNSTHYALQLMTYRYILEKHYDVTISALFLALFHPDHPTFRFVNAESLVPNGRELVQQMLLVRTKAGPVTLKHGRELEAEDDLGVKTKRTSRLAEAQTEPRAELDHPVSIEILDP